MVLGCHDQKAPSKPKLFNDWRFHFLCFVIYDGFNLFTSRSRIPLQKLIDRCASLEIFEERRNRHPRATEDKGSTEFFGVAFNGWAGIPIGGHLVLRYPFQILTVKVYRMPLAP